MDARKKILDCALELFSDWGYDGVGVQQIVEAAGLTKPTLYHYFGSKRGLLEALLREHFEPRIGRLRQAAAYKGDIRFTLDQISLASLELTTREPRFSRLVLAIWHAPPKSEAAGVATPWIEVQSSILEETFKAASENNGNMRGRHKTYTASFLGLLNAQINLTLVDPAGPNEEMRRLMMHQFLHGIFS